MADTGLNECTLYNPIIVRNRSFDNGERDDASNYSMKHTVGKRRFHFVAAFLNAGNTMVVSIFSGAFKGVPIQSALFPIS